MNASPRIAYFVLLPARFSSLKYFRISPSLPEPLVTKKYDPSSFGYATTVRPSYLGSITTLPSLLISDLSFATSSSSTLARDVTSIGCLNLRDVMLFPGT